MLFGVGLVLFDLSKDDPQFSIRVRANRFSPDMFYVNEFADRLKHHDAEIFEELFGRQRPTRNVLLKNDGHFGDWAAVV
jgi:hypothetical protein